ncbi:MAG: hypothetical protein IKM82_06280 [Oscillospiraceae bacterium]|nr:hypothetical protein [Oscillospiraceae bacterium]
MAFIPNTHQLTREQISILSYDEKLHYYEYLCEHPSINNGNGKTGPGCATISMPVHETCRHDAPCYLCKVCYCLKGRQCFANVLGAYKRNYRLYKQNPERFKEMVIAILKCSGLPLCRWNDSGELVDKEYFLLTVDVAKALPDIKFLCYTKKYDIVNEWLDEGNQFPENYTMRFSYLGKDWEVPNPHNLPVAYIDFTDKSLNPDIPRNAFKCQGNATEDDLEHTCTACKMCWNKRVHSVVFAQH